MNNNLPECDIFPEGDHRRLICRGEDGRPLNGENSVNQYRSLWGMPPLSNSSPPILILGWNFASAITRWTLAGMPRRTQAEIDERLAICQACPFLVDNHCNRCGCACVEQNQLINKLALATEKCPENKWD